VAAITAAFVGGALVVSSVINSSVASLGIIVARRVLICSK